MDANLTLSLIWEHLGVSLIPWLIIMLVGGGLGYLFATLFRHWFRGHPRSFHLIVLLPWRSISILIALVVVNTPLMVWNFGLGTLSASLAIGVALSVLFIPWITSTLLYSWLPINMLGKVFSIVRTSIILSLVLPVFLQTGVGYFIYQVSFAQDLSKMTLGYEVVGAMLLGADLLIGVIQYTLAHSRTV